MIFLIHSSGLRENGPKGVELLGYVAIVGGSKSVVGFEISFA